MPLRHFITPRLISRFAFIYHCHFINIAISIFSPLFSFHYAIFINIIFVTPCRWFSLISFSSLIFNIWHWLSAIIIDYCFHCWLRHFMPHYCIGHFSDYYHFIFMPSHVSFHYWFHLMPLRLINIAITGLSFYMPLLTLIHYIIISFCHYAMPYHCFSHYHYHLLIINIYAIDCLLLFTPLPPHFIWCHWLIDYRLRHYWPLPFYHAITYVIASISYAITLFILRHIAICAINIITSIDAWYFLYFRQYLMPLSFSDFSSFESSLSSLLSHYYYHHAIIALSWILALISPFLHIYVIIYMHCVVAAADACAMPPCAPFIYYAMPPALMLYAMAWAQHFRAPVYAPWWMPWCHAWWLMLIWLFIDADALHAAFHGHLMPLPDCFTPLLPYLRQLMRSMPLCLLMSLFALLRRCIDYFACRRCRHRAASFHAAIFADARRYADTTRHADVYHFMPLLRRHAISIIFMPAAMLMPLRYVFHAFHLFTLICHYAPCRCRAYWVIMLSREYGAMPCHFRRRRHCRRVHTPFRHFRHAAAYFDAMPYADATFWCHCWCWCWCHVTRHCLLRAIDAPTLLRHWCHFADISRHAFFPDAAFILSPSLFAAMMPCLLRFIILRDAAMPPFRLRRADISLHAWLLSFFSLMLIRHAAAVIIIAIIADYFIESLSLHLPLRFSAIFANTPLFHFHLMPCLLWFQFIYLIRWCHAITLYYAISPSFLHFIFITLSHWLH